MGSLLKPAHGPYQHVRGDAGSPKHLVCETAATTALRGVIGNEHQEVKVAVRAMIPPRLRSQEVNSLRLICRQQAFEDLGQRLTVLFRKVGERSPDGLCC